MSFQPVANGLDLSALDAFGVQWSTWTVDGWGTPGVTLNPVQKTRQRGATAGDSFDTGRHLALTGLVVAPSQDALVAALLRLNVAISRDEFPLVVTEAGTTQTVYARRSDQIIPTYITATMASWSVQVFCDDPRKFYAPLTGSTGLGVASGGFVVPEVWPLVVAAGGVSNQVALVNSGTETGPVVVRVDGPCAPFTVTHSSSLGTSIFASSLTLNTGEYVLIDMEAKSMMANGQSSRSLFITSRVWSGFDLGNNTWTFTASSYNAASLMTVTATPAN
jgi:hypothetical protein